MKEILSSQILQSKQLPEVQESQSPKPWTSQLHNRRDPNVLTVEPTSAVQTLLQFQL